MYDNDNNKRNRRLINDMPAGERPDERLESLGVGSLSIVELLAITLGRPDGVDLAYDMLIRFNGLRGLARAHVNELENFYGIGRKTAVRVKAAIALGVRSVTTYGPERERITSPADAANILIPLISNKVQEHLVVVILDTRNMVIATPTLYIGSINSTVIRIAEIFKLALVRNGPAIIIGHNHPSGDPTPSPEDVHVTRQITKAGNILDIDVLDHIVVGHARYVSLKERGLLD